MAAPDLSAVVTFYNKAFDLQRAGHRERSAEYTKRALAAAQALGAEDCIIVASLQIDEAKCVHNAAHGHLYQRALGAAPPFAAILPPFFMAVATLQRRKAAGTLLSGSCRAAEVTWDRLTSEHIASVHQNKSSLHAAAAAMSPLVGYSTFLQAANFGFRIIDMAICGMLSVPEKQLRDCVVLMADAAELFMQPRICEHHTLGRECDFVDGMRKLVMLPEDILPHGAAGARLLDSWHRLEHSGVLQKRCSDLVIQHNNHAVDAVLTAAAEASAAPGLRHCALTTCGAREQHPSHFKSCAACRGVTYCCKGHQTKDWPSHKAACKAARKAAAEQKQAD